MYAPAQVRFLEYDVLGKDKPQGYCNAGRDDISGNRGRNGHPEHIAILFLEQKIETEPVNEDIEQLIGSAAGQVPEGLFVYPCRKWTMKKVDELKYVGAAFLHSRVVVMAAKLTHFDIVPQQQRISLKIAQKKFGEFK